MEYEDIADKLFIINIATVERLFELGANEWLLYTFYLKTAKWQKSTDVWANNEYVMKFLEWGLKKVRDTKESLIKNGFIEQVREVDKETGKVLRWKVRLKYIQGLNHQVKNDPVDEKTTGSNVPLVDSERQNNNNNKISKEIPESNNNTPVFRNTITYGNNITQYYPHDVAFGDILADHRPTKSSEIKEPTVRTKPEDVGLVKVELDNIQQGDWERLMNWFEYNRRYKNKVIKPYCKREFKQAVELLRNLTGDNWIYAIDALEYSVDRCYHGFGKADGLYYGLKSREDYEDELKIARGFQAAPESLPEHLSRYKPIVYDMAEKYFTHWIEQMKNNTTTDPERLAFEIKDIEQRLNWVLEQKKTLQSKKSC